MRPEMRRIFTFFTTVRVVHMSLQLIRFRINKTAE